MIEEQMEAWRRNIRNDYEPHDTYILGSGGSIIGFDRKQDGLIAVTIRDAHGYAKSVSYFNREKLQQAVEGVTND